MNEQTSRKSSRRSYKSNSQEVSPNMKRNQWNRCTLTCKWNLTCKALFVGFMLMFIGGGMATIGYFVEHIYSPTNTTRNDTVTARDKIRLNINNISTYLGPMVMGVGGFIVVAACVLTFEQRDNAAKINPNRLHLSSTHGHSINRHKSSMNTRQPIREGSGRRPTPSSSGCYNGGDSFTEYNRRGDLTADFIQFSRNLQQASIEKTFIAQQSSASLIGRCPSAPNLAASSSPDALSFRSGSTPRGHAKHSRNSLHPFIGQPFLSPHGFHRQALSVDNPDYYPYHISPPRSKHSSRQGSTCMTVGGRDSDESLETATAANPSPSSRRSPRASKASPSSMVLDLHMPNDCPVSMRIRDRNKRSDTANRHLLMRQAQIESEEDSIDRGGSDSRCGSPQFGSRCGLHSSSTPHSRRESYSPRVSSVDCEPPVCLYRTAAATVFRGSSPSLQPKRGQYTRSNTICHEGTACRKSSNIVTTAESATSRKGSADYYRTRRKSSNTSESGHYHSRTNVDEGRCRTRSPTASLKSFQHECGYVFMRENDMKTDLLRQIELKRKQSRTKSNKGKSVWPMNQSLSPDSVSVSSSTTEGHSKSDFTSIEVESIEDDVHKKV